MKDIVIVYDSFSKWIEYISVRKITSSVAIIRLKALTHSKKFDKRRLKIKRR